MSGLTQSAAREQSAVSQPMPGVRVILVWSSGKVEIEVIGRIAGPRCPQAEREALVDAMDDDIVVMFIGSTICQRDWIASTANSLFGNVNAARRPT